MAIKDMVKAGLWIGTAQAVLRPGSLATALTAAGSNQATALALTSEVNVIGTAAASTGVALPAAFDIGDEFVVVNGGANAITVYPFVGGYINALAQNAGVSVAAGASQTFKAVTSTLFVTK